MCLAFIVNAKHLEFMGIPINGTITTFQTQLQAKGCTPVKDNNKLPSGIRGYNGVFAGKDCKIFVEYNNSTKQVYQVRACIDCYSIEYARSTFKNFKYMLRQKYDDYSVNTDTSEDLADDFIDNREDEFFMIIVDPSIQETVQPMGAIDVKILDLGTIDVKILDFAGDQVPYLVNITYEDFDNSSKNEENILNDL